MSYLDDYDFTFTTEYPVESEAVSRAFYNEDEQYVVVSLNGGVYRYDNVDKDFADSINSVYSVGRQWLPLLKRDFGPGEYLGEFTDLDYLDTTTLNSVPLAAALAAPANDGVIRKGDRVKVKENFDTMSHGTIRAGSLATVTADPYAGGVFLGGLEFDNGYRLVGGWFASRFEKVVEAPAAAPKAEPVAAPEPVEVLGRPGDINVGDRVKVVSIKGTGLAYGGGHVGEYGTFTEEYGAGLNHLFVGKVELDNGYAMQGAYKDRFARVEPVAEPESTVTEFGIFNNGESVGAQSYQSLTVDEPEAEVPTKAEYQSLRVVEDNSGLRKFVVAFESGGAVRDYTLYESDWNSAVSTVVELGEALGLEFNVKGVSVLD